MVSNPCQARRNCLKVSWDIPTTYLDGVISAPWLKQCYNKCQKIIRQNPNQVLLDSAASEQTSLTRPYCTADATACKAARPKLSQHYIQCSTVYVVGRSVAQKGSKSLKNRWIKDIPLVCMYIRSETMKPKLF